MKKTIVVASMNTAIANMIIAMVSMNMSILMNMGKVSFVPTM